MAEANSEMLEEQLKRRSTAPSARVVSGPAASPVTSNLTYGSRPSSPMPGNISEQRPRPSSLNLASLPANSAPSSAAHESSKSWFWSNNKKKPNEAPTTSGRTSGEYSKGLATAPMPVTSGGALPGGRPVPTRSATHSGQPVTGVSKSLGTDAILLRQSSTSPSTPTHTPGPALVSNAELASLRTAYSSALSKLSSLTTELADLKRTNSAMEAELESLSQALFEEANKMVAEERKRRAEVEENLKEVREEREALKETVKVLGGKVSPTHEDGEPPKKKASEEMEEPLVPRDLDKHYAALRKTIHNVASPPISPPASTSRLPATFELPESGPASRASPEEMSRPLSVSLPAESNPWASSAEFAEAPAGLGLGVEEGESVPTEFRLSVITPSPRQEKGGEGLLGSGLE